MKTCVICYMNVLYYVLPFTNDGHYLLIHLRMTTR